MNSPPTTSPAGVHQAVTPTKQMVDGVEEVAFGVQARAGSSACDIQSPLGISSVSPLDGPGDPRLAYAACWLANVHTTRARADKRYRQVCSSLGASSYH